MENIILASQEGNFLTENLPLVWFIKVLNFYFLLYSIYTPHYHICTLEFLIFRYHSVRHNTKNLLIIFSTMSLCVLVLKVYYMLTHQQRI